MVIGGWLNRIQPPFTIRIHQLESQMPQEPPKSFNAALPGPHSRTTGAPRNHRQTSVNPRIRRRGGSAAEVRRTRRRALFVLSALLVIECGAAALTSPAVTIREIRLTGITALPTAESANVLLATQVPPGSNWFRVPTSRIAARLTAMPWVAAATVEKRFPDRIYVNVAPREPAAILRSGMQAVETDAEAIPIRPARAEVAASLRQVVLPDGYAFTYGRPIQDDGVRAALYILRSTQADTTVPIAKIEVDQSDNLCLNMRDNTPIRLGQAEDLDAKLGQVRRICRSQPNLAKSFVAINLTCPSKPACTPRVAPSPAAAMKPVDKAGVTE
jgi:cell division septal protein FtsQ